MTWHFSYSVMMGIGIPVSLAVYLAAIGIRSVSSSEVKQSQSGIVMLSRLAGIALQSGLHFWINFLLLLLILCLYVDSGLSVEVGQLADVDLHAVLRAVLYLGLSEMFHHGFLWHPYGGYFLNVHGSERSEEDCQPTSSSYGWFVSICTGNLNFHVEHHDFPSTPWLRLPKVRAMAPEFYDKLTSRNLCEVVCSQVCGKHSGGYACT